MGLIDEYRIFVNPIVLGNGKPLFKDIQSRLTLKHINTKTFGNGLVLLCYRPEEKITGNDGAFMKFISLENR